MIKVLALVGESGSGKSAIAEKLGKLGYNVINSFTTREPRTPDETGHIFGKDMEDFTDDFIHQRVVADTLFSGNEYWTTIDQFEEGWNVYVIDPVGIHQLYLDDRFMALGVYVKANEVIRYRRMINTRGADYTVKRIMHDSKAFKVIQCDYVVDNNGSLEETVQTIKNIMEGYKNE